MIKNNIIKKITALSVSCTLSVALLAGCGNSDNSQKDTTAKVSDKKSETATPHQILLHRYQMYPQRKFIQ